VTEKMFSMANPPPTGLPQLNLAKSADKASAIPGDFITYTLDYFNSGVGSSFGDAIYDTIPAHTQWDSETLPGGVTAAWVSGSGAAGSLRKYSVGDLLRGQCVSGAPGSIQLKVQVPPSACG